MPLEAETGREGRYWLTIVPRFTLDHGFPGRIDCNGGVERRGEGFVPRDDWRSLTTEELSELVREVAGPSAVLPATHLGLLQIPERIRGAWWKEAEKSAESQRFEGVFSALMEFLRFKKLPLPERVHLEVAVNAPNLASTRGAPKGRSLGLSYRDGGATGQESPQQTLSLLNLGDEAAFIVFHELPPSALAARLAAVGAPGGSALSPHQLVNRYFERFSHERLLRMKLEPGEGVWLSPEGVVHDGWTRGKHDLDVVLSVRTEVGDAAHSAGKGTPNANERAIEKRTRPKSRREREKLAPVPGVPAIPGRALP
jgi:hypothetical protein